MARMHVTEGDDERLKADISRSIQSGHLNFLIGSGASLPAIPTGGAIEQEIAKLFQAGDASAANVKLYELLASVQRPMNELISDNPTGTCAQSLESYREFLVHIERILIKRSPGILPRQATIFTTNYDIFLEKASAVSRNLEINTGFTRLPSFAAKPEFATTSYFLTHYTTGYSYEYKVELPSLNIVKLHGCASWRRDTTRIVLGRIKRDLLSDTTDEVAVKRFLDAYAVVLPRDTKFTTTVLDRTYYELLRLFANQLDKENALLLVFGFSFQDEHIQHITQRALRNPTLRVLLFAYSTADADSFATLFEHFNNVTIISPLKDKLIDFTRFNTILKDISPRAEQ